MTKRKGEECLIFLRHIFYRLATTSSDFYPVREDTKFPIMNMCLCRCHTAISLPAL